MPRNMSFSLTTKQIQDRSKTVTRRLGWWFLKPGDILNACVKCQGLKKGERIRKICQISVVSTTEVPLCSITHHDCYMEGFQDMYPSEFVSMFRREMHCALDTKVNRIEFEYL